MAREEAKQRLGFLKHIIEKCDGCKSLYVNGNQITKEDDLQRLFRFVWYGTNCKADAEPNSGREQADKNIVVFKLASNSALKHVFTQVNIYEAANCSDGSLIAIFYFSDNEYLNSKSIVTKAGFETLINKSIYFIDCRNDKKSSASIT